MTEEKEVKKSESKVADAAWLRDTAERHRAFAGNSGGWFIGRTFTIDDFRDDEEKEKKDKKEWGGKTVRSVFFMMWFLVFWLGR